MSIFFEESYMNEIMGMFCPEGETVITAVRGVGQRTEIYQYFCGCVETVDRLVPADRDNMIKVLKKKVCAYDLYIGYTEKSLIMTLTRLPTLLLWGRGNWIRRLPIRRLEKYFLWRVFVTFRLRRAGLVP